MRNFRMVLAVLLFLVSITFAKGTVNSSDKSLEWKLLVFTELGFEYVDNSYFSTTSTQDNIWNQEVKEIGELELGFQFKPHKKIKLKVEVEFDKHSPQPKFKDFWLAFNLKSKQKVKLGYFKNQFGQFFNTQKQSRLGLNRTLVHDFVRTTMIMERDLGLEYRKSFRKQGEGLGLSIKTSLDASKNFFTNPSVDFETKSFLFKIDYVGVLSQRKEYDLSSYNQLASFSGGYQLGSVLKRLPTYEVVNEVFMGDNVASNLRYEILDLIERKYFVALEQKHSLGVGYDYRFLKGMQYVLGASMLNPSSLRNFEMISGVNLHLTKSSSLIWKSELLWRFLSHEGFTVASSVQFFL